jgi:chorismate synthase
LTTQRIEKDAVEFLSGIFEGKTTGAPIAFIIRNKDQRSEDYEKMKDVFRPSHADYTYTEKYGVRDHRGGGRSSARETACRVVGGAIAKQLLQQAGITITAHVRQVGNISLKTDFNSPTAAEVEASLVRCPSVATSEEMIRLIEDCRNDGDSVGGVIQCVMNNVPSGLGEPVYGKFQAKLAEAMMGINAVKGFELGSGFALASLKGSHANDEFTTRNGKTQTVTNHSGGVQGGITNGMPVYFNVAFKPVATIRKPQQTVDKKGQQVELSASGRHDPCVLPRAVPIVEAMAALVAADMLLLSRARKQP